MQTVIPMISYANAAAAADWLVSAFGFVEVMRLVDDQGVVNHAELRLGDGVVFLATPTPAYQGPSLHAEGCAAARAWLASPWVIDGVLVYVDDVDAHHRRAAEAGAVMLTGIEDGYPGRRYRVQDCEGHRWMFMQRG